ncbi:MAG: hypothetical protein GTN80_06785 [Nitrososphaeria archaeon]|nr:hypothetical protein [Nitrososphaeria archaeon]NIN52785.1 hypothetical protein [Nitrososphaeria archaeon]NIQ33331.1 hypothetical protein [Nitrososphaeria archaeon]
MEIKFEKISRKVVFLNPSKDFSEEEHVIEYRADPLTGRRCRISVERATRAEMLASKELDEAVLEEICRTKKTCYFCEHNLESQTPKFHPKLIGTERIRVGEAVVVPNLYPFGEYHGVCVVSKDHLTDLRWMGSEMLKQSFKASIRFFRAVNEKDREAIYPSVNCNFLHPAGASIPHAHLQIFVERKGTETLDELTDRSKEYFLRNERCFWVDLVEKEEASEERHIGRSGSFSWLASWSPLGNNEILGVAREPISCITDLEDTQIGDLAEGLSKVLKGLREKRGVFSLNFSVYSSPMVKENGEFFRLFIKIISRPSPRSFYASDQGFMEVLQREPVIHTMPEDVARDIRTYFADRRG